MRSVSRVEARPILGTFRSQGIEPFLVLRDFCFPFFEFIAAHGHRLKRAGSEKQEKSDDKSFHNSLRSHIRVVPNARLLPFALKVLSSTIARPKRPQSGSFVTTWKPESSDWPPCRVT